MDIFLFNIKSANKYNKEELEKYSKKEFKNEKQKLMHCFSYMMCEKILIEKYGIINPKIIFKNKKPILETSIKHFSISHSKEYIALAFSDFNCGIDIEYSNKNKDYKKIAKRMNFVCNSIEDFYKEWTAYEAGYKLSEPAKSSYSFSIPNYSITATSSNDCEEFNLC